MNIYVGNISFRMSDEEMREAFAAYGEVTSCKIIMDRETGRSKGFGFVEMSNDADGTRAINELNGRDIGGRELRVNEARPREDAPHRRF